MLDEIGRGLDNKWKIEHGYKIKDKVSDSPYNLDKISKIKKEYEKNPDETRQKYPDIFYYFDGMLNVVVSESFHPAGIIASPINLIDNYGGSLNDKGQVILPINMEECHEINLVKFDILSLVNIKIIRDACKYANIPYPQAYKINWCDENVWQDITTSPVGIFQFESKFAFESLKKFQPHKLDDMTIVTAAIRPSGESYRNRLLNHELNKNPSALIDDLLKDNNGYLCIAKDSMIATKEGVVPIQDIKIGDLVYTTNGLDTVKNAVKTGNKNVYEIKTLYNTLRCTDEHKILTHKGFKKLSELSEGDVVALYVGTESTQKYNKDLLRIIGWHLGDGSSTKRNIVSIINRDYDVVKEYKDCIERIWDNLTLTIRDVKTRVTKQPLYKGLVVWKNIHHNYDKPIHKYLDEIQLRNIKGINKFVPEFIYSLNRECLLIFLGAYTDTDSSLNEGGVQYKTASKKLCDGIIEIIRRLGYCCSMTYDNKTGGYAIVPRGGKQLLLELWKYSIKVQKKFPNGINIIRPNRLGVIPTKDVIEWVKSNGITQKKVNVKAGISLKTNSIGYTRMESVNKIANIFNIQNPFYINDNIVFVDIRSISKCGYSDVYDLTIEHTHNFVANGTVVHNCYQEDVLRFLVEICGMSGSEADNVRRAIGRKQVDRLQKALPQILEGYCNKSDKPREIAEQEAKEFLQIIEDASSYMFGRNHATAYSMIGYILGWLRYYYPLEFLTSFLNNANTDEDTLNGTELANQKGIKIKAPKFGYAHNEYMCDKESNTIYKGLGSIKDMQSIAADIMLDIADKNPETFVDVLFLTKECKIDNKKINKKSLDILLNIGFFDMFGTIPELKSILHWFDKYKKCKTVKRETLTDEWLIEIIRKNAGKESEKQFREIDNKGIVKDIYNMLPKQAEDNTALIRNQIKHLGYADIGNDNISPLEYYVQDVNEDKWGRIWLSLYQLSSGISKRYKCDKTWFKRLPCIKDDIIKAIFKSKEKMKVVGEDEDGKKIFARTGEYENIVKGYSIVK